MDKVVAMFRSWTAQSDEKPSKVFSHTDADGKAVYDEVTGVNVSMGAITYDPGTSPDSAENMFARSTPSGNFNMRVMNEAIREAGFFEPGKNYKITIEKLPG